MAKDTTKVSVGVVATSTTPRRHLANPSTSAALRLLPRCLTSLRQTLPMMAEVWSLPCWTPESVRALHRCEGLLVGRGNLNVGAAAHVRLGLRAKWPHGRAALYSCALVQV